MNLLVISGGRRDLPHPFEESTPILGTILKGAGHEVTVTEDPGVLADAARMSEYDALVLNTVRAGDNGMTKAEQAGMSDFIDSGKGLVCLHVSSCAPDDWPEYYDITGGGWILGKSSHPPYGKFKVDVTNPKHPGARGISDFIISDELYMNIEYRDGNDLFISSDFDGNDYARNNPHVRPMNVPGGTFPLGWTRMFGNGRVLVTLLGHDGLSMETPELQRIVLNGIEWVTSKD